MLRLAESLGAETVTLDGPSAADALLEYARLRNVTRIVVGETEAQGLARVAAPIRRPPNSCAAAAASTCR